MDPLVHLCARIAEYLVQGGPADLSLAGDVCLAGTGLVCDPCKALNGNHGLGCLTFGVCAPPSLGGEFGEGGLGSHANSVKHLTSEAQGRKVVYMNREPIPSPNDLHVGDHVRVLSPGRFNPNVPGNREPDSWLTGTITGRTPGVPITWHIQPDNAARRITVAHGNVFPRRGEFFSEADQPGPEVKVEGS